MSQLNNFESKLVLIAQELQRLNQNKFTGKTTVEINYKDGGIGSIGINTQKNLILKP